MFVFAKVSRYATGYATGMQLGNDMQLGRKLNLLGIPKSSVFSYMKHIALTVPLQCPYSALTMPLWFLHSALTISMTGRGGPEVPYLAFLECKGTV